MKNVSFTKNKEGQRLTSQTAGLQAQISDENLSELRGLTPGWRCSQQNACPAALPPSQSAPQLSTTAVVDQPRVCPCALVGLGAAWRPLASPLAATQQARRHQGRWERARAALGREAERRPLLPGRLRARAGYQPVSTSHTTGQTQPPARQAKGCASLGRAETRRPLPNHLREAWAQIR